MSVPAENPGQPTGSRHHQEYEDPHYHDEDEVEPVDDSDRQTRRPPGRRPPSRRPPRPRRRYDD